MAAYNVILRQRQQKCAHGIEGGGFAMQQYAHGTEQWKNEQEAKTALSRPQWKASTSSAASLFDIDAKMRQLKLE